MNPAHLGEHTKQLLDYLSVGALLATFLDYLPVVTAVAVLIWTVLRCFESYQNIMSNRRAKAREED